MRSRPCRPLSSSRQTTLTTFLRRAAPTGGQPLEAYRRPGDQVIDNDDLHPRLDVIAVYSRWSPCRTPARRHVDVARGSLPCLRIGMNALCRLYAIGVHRTGIRGDSRPAIASNSTSSSAVISSHRQMEPSASPSTVVISRKMMPSFGKSGMLVIYCSTLPHETSISSFIPAARQRINYAVLSFGKQNSNTLYILSNRAVCDKRLIVRNVDFYHEDYCRYTNPHQIVHYRIWNGRCPDD